MRKHVLALALSVAFKVCAAAPLPPDLAGVWASEEAVLKGQVILDGSALYLNADGSGIWAGVDRKRSTALGSRLFATFDRVASAIEADMVEGGKVVKHVRLAYDVPAMTLEWREGVDRVRFTRRFDAVAQATRDVLRF